MGETAEGSEVLSAPPIPPIGVTAEEEAVAGAIIEPGEKSKKRKSRGDDETPEDKAERKRKKKEKKEKKEKKKSKKGDAESDSD